MLHPMIREEKPLEQTRLLTAQEAADYLRITRPRLYQLVRDGELVGHRVGYQYRFMPADLEDYLRRSIEPPEGVTP